LKDHIYNNFYRTVHFDELIVEDSIELDIDNCSICFQLYLCEKYQNIDELLEEFNHLSSKLDKDIIDDDKCLQGCGFQRRQNDFCSIHFHVEKNLYAEKHYEHVRMQIIKKFIC